MLSEEITTHQLALDIELNHRIHDLYIEHKRSEMEIQKLYNSISYPCKASRVLQKIKHHGCHIMVPLSISLSENTLSHVKQPKMFDHFN